MMLECLLSTPAGLFPRFEALPSLLKLVPAVILEVAVVFAIALLNSSIAYPTTFFIL
jgi:hypothetical protein